MPYVDGEAANLVAPRKRSLCQPRGLAAINRAEPGLIRVDADEMSYSLHIMQRYEIEKQLLAGKLAVRDLPEAWNAGMEQRFGQRPAGAADGCLQIGRAHV